MSLTVQPPSGGCAIISRLPPWTGSPRCRGWRPPPRPPLSPISREAAGTTMAIDPATRANLELTRTLAGERRGSLLDAIDCTVTPAGSRLLAQRLAAPLTDNAAIAGRLDAVSLFVADSVVRDDIRAVLRAAPDMSRALARLS